MGGHQYISIRKEIKLLLIFAKKLKIEFIVLSLSGSGLVVPCHIRYISILMALCQYLFIYA